MTCHRVVLLALVLVSNGVVNSALAADPTAEEKETARGMMDEGHARRDVGDHRGALAQFQGAEALMHVPTTGLEVAREQAALGLLAEARDTLQRIVHIPPAADEPEAFRAARDGAKFLDDELARRIPALVINIRDVNSDAPMQVTVDDVQVPLAALIAPFKVNPGHHVIVATTSGGAARKEVDVTDGQTATVVFDFATAGPRAQPVPPGAARRPKDADLGTSPPIVPWLRWGGFGLGIAGMGVGSVTGAISISTTSSERSKCTNDRCPPTTWSGIDSARMMATISTVSFIAAGVGAALVIASFSIAGSTAAGNTARATPRVSPWIGAGSLGVDGAF
jgi:hypothetical protein